VSIELKLTKELPHKSLDGITSHDGAVLMAKTGEGHGMPWLTAYMKIDPNGALSNLPRR